MVMRLMRQAAVMSFIDVFLIIAVLFSTLAIAALLMKALPRDVTVEAHRLPPPQTLAKLVGI